MSDSDDGGGTFEVVNVEIDFDENPADYPPIFIAARDGNVQAMRDELASGVDPNLRDPHSHLTPLHVIVANRVEGAGNIYSERCPNEPRLMACTRLLLDAGAQPCLLDSDGQNTVYNAVCHNHHEILAMLLEAGARAVVDHRNDGSNWTALSQATRSGHMECLDLLLAAGADVNLRVQNESLDHSPLEMAMMWDDHGDLRRVFPVLLRAGAAIPNVTGPYLRKVKAAGGFPAYERAHRLRLATILARVVFPRLPLEMVSHVVAFAFHTGDY